MFIELLKLFQKAFVRLRTAAMNPFRRVVRRFQQLFNVNLITAKLINPINKKIRAIFSFKPKSKEDYVTIGNFWISRKVIYFLILALCAGVFIYFTWFAPAVEETVTTTNVVTTTYYDYDDLDLAEFSGKANIRAANGAVVYTGDIAAGVCTGVGTLWTQEGVLVYEGMFDNNQFSGKGILYYPNGEVKYDGEFAENTFNGNGYYYNTDGSLVYSGEFANGSYSGAGIAYNEKENMIYEGQFQSGNYHGEGTLYYDNGIKEYTGEFYLGAAQGVGTWYSRTGKQLFTGQFARNEIHYESLLGINMEEAMTMFGEIPTVYYSEGETVFLFNNAGVVLEGDCMVQLKKDSSVTATEDDWYLPGEEEDTLEELEENTQTVVFNDKGEASVSANASDGVQLPILGNGDTYSAYYYLSSDEWQRESDLDLTMITVEAVTTFRDEIGTDFLSAESMTPANGGTSLIDCVAIDRIRIDEPTAFSNISFEQTTKNKNFIYVSGINMAQAIYAEIYELEGVRYKLCYQVDSPDNLEYMTLELY